MLNSKTRDELEELNIEDRKETVMEVKRVLTQKNLMVQLENKCKELELQINRFNRKFSFLQNKGLPTLRNSNGKLIPLENYHDQLCNATTNASKFVKTKGNLSGEAFLEGLQSNLNIQHEVHRLFLNNPTFQTCREVDERL